jgi:hypothetical protein
MHDAAASGHPRDVAGSEEPFVAIAHLAFDDEGHDFEASVWMGATRTLSRRNLDEIVREQDERIIVREFPRLDDMNCRMAFTDKPW